MEREEEPSYSRNQLVAEFERVIWLKQNQSTFQNSEWDAEITLPKWMSIFQPSIEENLKKGKRIKTRKIIGNAALKWTPLKILLQIHHCFHELMTCLQLFISINYWLLLSRYYIPKLLDQHVKNWILCFRISHPTSKTLDAVFSNLIL